MKTIYEDRIVEHLRKPWTTTRALDVFLDHDRAAWDHARSVSFTAEIDEQTARRWLPPALTPARPARATIFVADYPSVLIGVPYREVGVLLHATRRRLGRSREEVVHCAWMVVDDDSAMVLGREMLGFPKKLAEIDFELGEDGSARARVSRRGFELLKIEATGASPSEGEPILPKPLINAKGNVAMLPGSLWRMQIRQKVHQGWTASAEVKVAGSPFDPLDELGVRAGAHPAHTGISDMAIPRPGKRGGWLGAARFVDGVRPVGLVSHRWLLERLPFRTL